MAAYGRLPIYKLPAGKGIIELELPTSTSGILRVHDCLAILGNILNMNHNIGS